MAKMMSSRRISIIIEYDSSCFVLFAATCTVQIVNKKDYILIHELIIIVFSVFGRSFNELIPTP